MGFIKDKVRKAVMQERSDSESYIKYLRNKGVLIGNDVTIYVPSKTLIDEQYPWMISIGNHVRITEGVKVLTHDYSWSVLKGLKNDGGAILGASGFVTIGNNVFIGMNTVITRNVTIGDNVIIGAGSIVTEDCEANSVYAGNPAKKLMSLDSFYEKRVAAQAAEAKELAVRYYERYGERPPVDIFHEYFMLFCTEENLEYNEIFKEKINLCDNREQSVLYMKTHIPKFRNFNDFMRYCFDGEL